MKDKSINDVSRRGFFERAAQGLAAGAALFAAPRAQAAAGKPKAGKPSITPYADSIEALRRIDPALIHFERIRRFPSPRPEPKRVAYGAGDRLIVTTARHVTVLDRDGERALEFEPGGEVRSLAVAADGLMYVGFRDQIGVFSDQGKRVAEWASPAKKPWFASLTVGENDLFATDASNRVVYRFDRAGKLLKRIGEKNSEFKAPGFVVPSPYFDLEIGRDGYLWVVNPGRHQFEAYTFDGRLVTTWGEPSFGIKGFCGCCNPSYFTLLPDGRFATSEKGFTRIKVYSAKGEFESVVAGAEAFPKYAENVNATPIPVDIAADAAGRIAVADTLGSEIHIYRRKAKT